MSESLLPLIQIDDTILANINSIKQVLNDWVSRHFVSSEFMCLDNQFGEFLVSKFSQFALIKLYSLFMIIIIITNLNASFGLVMCSIISSFSLAILSLALSFSLSSNSDVLNLPQNSCQSIFPSWFVSILVSTLSISLLVRPKLSFLMAFLNSYYEMDPSWLVSYYANICCKLRLDDLMIYLSFSIISVSH